MGVHVNPASSTWVAVEEWATKELEAALEILESSESDLAHTQFTRGYIKSLRGLLALPDVNKSSRDSASSHYE